MNITCDNCQSRFKIPDEKLTAGKSATFRCPKCRNRLTVNVPGPSGNGPVPDAAAMNNADMDAEIYNASEKPFDFIEEEGKTALVCESDPEVKARVIQVLEFMEYHLTEAVNARDALKKMRYHAYDLVVVDEDFDTPNPDANGVLIYLERQNMAVRRNMFVAMISRRFRTMDNMVAFQKSVNLVINVNNLADVDKILQRAIADNDYFYRILKESLA